MNKNELYNLYASCTFNSIHYKILFLLLAKPHTQKEISDELNIAKQSINRACKTLLSMDLIFVNNTIGRNKYLKINTNPKLQVKGQVNLFDKI